jgi:two-component system response regulator HydG
VRIIVASNRELWTTSQKGDFREDLFHRLNEFTIKVPPLRERKEDIIIFADHFLEKANQTLHKTVKGFSPEVENIFRTYPWYGNLRELKNVVKRAALLADGDCIESSSLPFEICNYLKLFGEESKAPENNTITYSFPSQELPVTEDNASSTTLKDAMIDMEYQLILKTLAKCNFNKSKAAKMLKIDRRTLYNKMNLYREHNQK